jgi:hypothetical protein
MFYLNIISFYILVYKDWWFSCSSRHNSTCHLPFMVLCCYCIFHVDFKYNNAWDSWFEYLAGWSTLWTPRMSATWSCFVVFIAIPSSVRCAVFLQRMYLFHYSSKKCNISFMIKWRAQVPPFGAGPSLSCFCCSKSLSKGDGPGPDHRDYNVNTYLIMVEFSCQTDTNI